MEKDYYLGLDLGTNSVGWAVTDLEYQLLRAKGKDLWGVRLFREAATAAERRGKRSSRRRLDREKARKAILKDFFAEAINEVDPGFYVRMEESFLKKEDRSSDNKQKFALFNDNGFNDKDFYNKYRTIFHLRKDLLHSNESFDVRLVFLAIYNMFEHRGHFLNSTLNPEDNNSDFETAYLNLAETLDGFEINLPSSIDFKKAEKILGDNKKSRSNICREFADFLDITKKDKKQYAVIELICGLNVKLSKLCDDEKIEDTNANIGSDNLLDEDFQKKSFGFRDHNFDEEIEDIHANMGDEWFNIIEQMKAVHDIGLLSKIMRGCDYLSDARVEIYEQHKKDLEKLKKLLKQYDKDSYEYIFRTIENASYSAYVGSVNSHGVIKRRRAEERSKEDLYEKIKSALKNVPEDDEDRNDIKRKIESGIFLEKQLTNKNGVIPNQVHSGELRKILSNAEKYLPFLSAKDETGLSTSEKIIALFEFQIPYYVGPLGTEFNGKAGYNCWAVRKENGKVYPWNINKKIDEAASRKEFIKRMIRRCSYLNNETTLPKNSLLYEKFMVLNEINTIKIDGNRLRTEVKQAIFNDLFMKGKKISRNKIKKYLVSINEMDQESEISGIDVNCNQSLTSIAKFQPVFKEEVELNRNIIEDIIFWGTIYSGDRKSIKSEIEERYPGKLDDDQMKRILGFKFSGWGRLSKEFLEMTGSSKLTGKTNSIIGFLWEDQITLMELMSSNYTFKEKIDEKIEKTEKSISEWTIEDFDGMYMSPSVKRITWQAMKVIDEIQHVLGKPPKRIFIEMTRGDGKKIRTVSRKEKLTQLYKNIGEEGKLWLKELEDKPEQRFKKRKLYLYYLQKGRCMYTGEKIEISQLMNDKIYNIDHIHPQCYTKDDSIENNLVLTKEEANKDKGDKPISRDIQSKMYNFWLELKKGGFINHEKFARLTRKNEEYTKHEKIGFINRQIVETGQAAKAITQILQQSMGKDCKIVFSKSGLVSDFRHKFKLSKSRLVNDLHHANDAYLNIVVGNSYFVKFTNNPVNFIENAERHSELDEYKYHLSDFFKRDIKNMHEVAWLCDKSENPTLTTVKNNLKKFTPLVTYKVEEGHGEYFKETIKSHEDAKPDSYIGVKTKNSPLCKVTEYGGKTSISTLGYSLVEYKQKNKITRSLKELPILLGNSRTLTDEAVLEYFKNLFIKEGQPEAAESLRICERFIPKQSLLKIDGGFYYLGGRTGKQVYLYNAVQLKIDLRWIEYIQKLEKADLKNDYDEIDCNKKRIITKEKNIELYKLIMSKMQKQPYKKRYANLIETIEKGLPAFEQLTEMEQSKILIGFVFNISKSQKMDLRLIGGSKEAGISRGTLKISNYNEVKLIAQSVTGLFVFEKDLLKL